MQHLVLLHFAGLGPAQIQLSAEFSLVTQMGDEQTVEELIPERFGKLEVQQILQSCNVRRIPPVGPANDHWIDIQAGARTQLSDPLGDRRLVVIGLERCHQKVVFVNRHDLSGKTRRDDEKQPLDTLVDEYRQYVFVMVAQSVIERQEAQISGRRELIVQKSQGRLERRHFMRRGEALHLIAEIFDRKGVQARKPRTPAYRARSDT